MLDEDHEDVGALAEKLAKEKQEAERKAAQAAKAAAAAEGEPFPRGGVEQRCPPVPLV